MIRHALDRLAWWLLDRKLCDFANLTDDEGEE